MAAQKSNAEEAREIKARVNKGMGLDAIRIQENLASDKGAEKN